MKRLIIVLAFVAITLNANAQDVYSVGYYNINGGSVAALYKNGNKLYIAHHGGTTSKATRVTCNSQGDVYWLVNFYDYPDGTYNHTEIRVNNQVYASNENHREVHIADMYCLNDTLYYAGYQYNEDSVLVATVWKGDDYSIHWVIGDGVHPSSIAYSDIDKRTGIPYFCGYVINDKKKAAVWEGQELLYTFDQDSLNMYEAITESNATRIAVANGHVYTIGSFDTDWPINLSAIWKDNVLIDYCPPYEAFIHDVGTFENSYYFSVADRWGDYVLKNGQTQMLWIGYASNIFSTITDIFVIGEDVDYKFYIWKNFEKQCQIENCDAINDACVFDPFIEPHTEWYYEIQNENGSITYQHLEYTADTTINNERPKIILRSNTLYDRDEIITETTHEYVYEKNGKVYWWNKDLEEFTVLYDLAAQSGDEWEIKVGTESLIMHVDSVEYIDHEGSNYRTLHVSDADNLFTGDIVCGIGHLTSFFPERLMNRGKDYRVEGLRCYWIGDELVFKIGDDDCDAIYSELHGIEEQYSGNGYTVYPNPANNVLFVEMPGRASLQDQTYRITNLIGQTILSGRFTSENQQIDISTLPEGMYFITIGDETLKFMRQ